MDFTRKINELLSPNSTNNKTKIACFGCRKNKTKCSGCLPTCKRCLTKGLTCTYEAEKERDRSGQLYKISNRLELEIEVQKQLAQRWKYMLQQISPKLSINIPSMAKDVKLSKPNINIATKRPSDPYMFNDECLQIINSFVLGFPEHELHCGREMLLDEAQRYWDSLANGVLSYSELECLDIGMLVELWEKVSLFVMPCLYQSLEFQEEVLWKNNLTLMRLVIWEKELHNHPMLIPKVVCLLYSSSPYFYLNDMHGAAVSSLLLAYNLSTNSKEWISDGVMDSLSIDLLMNVTMSMPEKSEIIKALENKALSDKSLQIRYSIAYCLSSLNASDELDYEESDNLSRKLYDAETIGSSHLGEFTKCQTHAIRSELAYKQGYHTLGDEWLASSLEMINSISDLEVVEYVYSALNLGLQALEFRTHRKHVVEKIIGGMEKKQDRKSVV